MFSARAKRPVAMMCLLLAAAVVPGCTVTHKERQEKAEQHWNQVRSRVKLQLASQQIERGRIDEAIKFVDEALSLDDSSAEGYVLLGRCYLEQGKLAAARRSIERAVSLDFPTAPLMSLQGVLAERQGRLDDALLYYRQARGMDDSNVSYLIAEAECLVAVNRPEEAASLLRSSLVDYDNDPSIHALLGEIALRMGDEPLAAQSFRTALASGRYDETIAEEYALLATRSGDYTGALTVLERLMKSGDSEPADSVVLASAQCQLALNRTEAAKQTLTRFLNKHPDETRGWLLLARAGMATDDLPTMRRGADRARQLAPRSPEALLVDAYVCLREGRLDRAEDALKRVVAIDDSDVLAYCMLGETAQRAADQASAKRYYRRALEIDPHCAWARWALNAMGEV